MKKHSTNEHGDCPHWCSACAVERQSRSDYKNAGTPDKLIVDIVEDCMTTAYKIWCPDRGEVEETAHIIYNNDLKTAVEIACTDRYWSDIEPFEELTLHASESNNHYALTHVVNVTVRAVPQFSVKVMGRLLSPEEQRVVKLL